MKKYIFSSFVFSFMAFNLAFAQVIGDVAPVNYSVTCINITTDLSNGSRDYNTGNDVSELQEFLINRGLLSGEATGYFGIATLRAVKAFQSEQGLLASGYVGPITRARINALGCNNTNNNNVYYGNVTNIYLYPNTLDSTINDIQRVGNVDYNFDAIVMTAKDNLGQVITSNNVNQISIINSNIPGIAITNSCKYNNVSAGVKYDYNNIACNSTNVINNFAVTFNKFSMIDEQNYYFTVRITASNYVKDFTYNFKWNKVEARCTVGFTWTGATCNPNQTCPSYQYWNGLQCVNIVSGVNSGTAPTCTLGYYWNGASCIYNTTTIITNTSNNNYTYVCPSGYYLLGNTCYREAVYTNTTIINNNNNNYNPCPTGSRWDGGGCYTTVW